MQKLNFGNNSDSLPHDGTDHSGFHGSNDSIYKSQQVLSQQSSSLLQQSKAKHQAMLAQVSYCISNFSINSLLTTYSRFGARISTDYFTSNTYSNF